MSKVPAWFWPRLKITGTPFAKLCLSWVQIYTECLCVSFLTPLQLPFHHVTPWRRHHYIITGQSEKMFIFSWNTQTRNTETQFTKGTSNFHHKFQRWIVDRISMAWVRAWSWKPRHWDAMLPGSGAHKNSWGLLPHGGKSEQFLLFILYFFYAFFARIYVNLIAKDCNIKIFLPCSEPRNSLHKPSQDWLITRYKAPAECWKVCVFYLHLLVHRDFVFESSVCDVPTLTGFKMCLPGTVLGSLH